MAVQLVLGLRDHAHREKAKLMSPPETTARCSGWLTNRGKKRGTKHLALIAFAARRPAGQRIAFAMRASMASGAVGTLDITLYRDDLSKVCIARSAGNPPTSVGVDNMDLVLVDDVLYTWAHDPVRR